MSAPELDCCPSLPHTAPSLSSLRKISAVDPASTLVIERGVSVFFSWEIDVVAGAFSPVDLRRVGELLLGVD